MSRPLRSPPITGASALLRAGPPACPHRYSTPHSFCCSTHSLSPPVTFPGLRSPYRHTPSHVPCSSRRPGSRRLHTGHHLASKRAPARLFPKFYIYPGFDVVSCFSMLHQRIAFARLPDPRLTAFTPPFPQSLTTTVFSLCSMRRLDVSPRRATPEGPQNLHLLHSIAPSGSTYTRPLFRIRGTHGGTRSRATATPMPPAVNLPHTPTTVHPR